MSHILTKRLLELPPNCRRNRCLLCILILLAGSSEALRGKEPQPPVDRTVEQAAVWDCDAKDSRHVIWQRPTGSHAGYLVVHGDRVLVTSNNGFFREPAPDPSLVGYQGTVMCFDRATGEFQWQSAHPMLERRYHIDSLAITSRPWVEQRRVYYVSNRCELVCLDLEGFYDGENDGPYKDEDQQDLAKADVVWKLDMMGELGVVPRAAGDISNPTSSPLVAGDLVYCVTGNGVHDWVGSSVANPDAPSFIAVDKETGKLVWTSNAPGKNIILSQWSSPGFARVEGHGQILFPGGDGWLYGFEALKGELIWKLDCNVAAGLRKSKVNALGYCFSVPVVGGNVVYLGLNRGVESDKSPPLPLLAIDLKQQGDVTQSAVKWLKSPTGVCDTLGPVAIDDGVIYMLGEDGYLVVIDQTDGTEIWRADLVDGPAYYGGPVVHDCKVFVPTMSQGVVVFAAGRQKKCIGRYEFNGTVCGSPVVDGDRLFVSTRSRAFSLRLPE